MPQIASLVKVKISLKYISYVNVALVKVKTSLKYISYVNVALLKAEHQVFPGSVPAFHLVQVQVQSLPNTLEELILEVIDSNVSTVMESWTVNRVNIMVVGKIIGSNHYNVQSDGQSSRNRFSVGRDKSQPVLPHQSQLTTTAYPLASWNHKMWNRNGGSANFNGDVGENLALELESLMSLECRKNKVKVTFPKSSSVEIATKLNGANIGWLEVTLKDQECKARSNNTHYILETHLNSCGSSMVPDGWRYYFKNQVLFWAPVRPEGISDNQKDVSSEFDESFADDEDMISSEDGSGLEHHLKQALANQQGITQSRLLFTQSIQCIYNLTGTGSRSEEVNHPHVFHMQLYKDSNFRKKLRLVDGLVEVLSRDNLYVKTAIDAGPDLFVVTDECWLSRTNNSLVMTDNREVLIQHSCPKHLSVGLLGVEPHGLHSSKGLNYQQGFFFHFTQRWVGHKVFLHCRLAVCSEKANSPLSGVKQCIDPKEYCVGNGIKQFLESRTGQHFSVEVEGPIYVLPSRGTRGRDSS
ncbi:transforming growth factor beta receptor type 3-like, partial [Limulus polyphemus]|uniref:Transforming growth factor beta receptor type 3-like n=1 Tax=Limulus polyphemus TaxID=6850 RepID=A0ABM1RX41_LIMPO